MTAIITSGTAIISRGRISYAPTALTTPEKTPMCGRTSLRAGARVKREVVACSFSGNASSLEKKGVASHFYNGRVKAVVMPSGRRGRVGVTCDAAATDISTTNDEEKSQESVVKDVSSAEDWEKIANGNSGKLVVLMCKALGCRPCKQFRRKYVKLAEHFADAEFYEIYGDRNESTRKLMRSMKIRATPTFVFYRNGELVHEHAGINPQKMIDALKVAVLPEETGYCENLHFVNGVLAEDEE